MSQSGSSSAEAVPKCRCGNGYMRLFTSHTKTNPNRKFWGCPKWTEGYGCGAFRWKDRGSVNHISASDTVACERIDTRTNVQKLSSNVEDLLREIQTQNQLVQLALEGRRDKKELDIKEHLYLQMIFYVLLFTVVLQFIGLAMWSSR